jgi:hypothetical protein
VESETLRIQKKTAMQLAVRKTTLNESQQATDLAYWLAQPVQARIDALEVLRKNHSQGQPHAETRLQRVCRIISLQQFNKLKQG